MKEVVIEEFDELLRRIPIRPSHLLEGKPTSACFKLKPDEDGISVNILKLTKIEDCIVDKKKYYAGIILAKDVFELGCTCKHDPKIGDYSHALILNVDKAIARKLASKCKIIVLR